MYIKYIKINILISLRLLNDAKYRILCHMKIFYNISVLICFIQIFAKKEGKEIFLVYL